MRVHLEAAKRVERAANLNSFRPIVTIAEGLIVRMAVEPTYARRRAVGSPLMHDFQHEEDIA